MKTAVPSRTHIAAAIAVCTTKLAPYLHTYRKIWGKIAAVVIGAAALVGIATLNRPPEVSVVTAVPTQPETIQAAQPKAAVASKPITDPVTGQTSSTAPLIGEYGFSFGATDQSIRTPLSIKAKEPLSDPKPEATPLPATPAVAEARPAVAEAPRPSPVPTTTRKEFVEIAVQLTIQDGRVAQAEIGNREPGAQAFEATALHIARQRRYPAGTSRTETVVVRVANQFGEKQQ